MDWSGSGELIGMFQAQELAEQQGDSFCREVTTYTNIHDLLHDRQARSSAVVKISGDALFPTRPCSSNKQSTSHCTHNKDDGSDIEYIFESEQIHK